MSFVIKNFKKIQEHAKVLPPEIHVFYYKVGKKVRIICGKLEWEGDFTREVKDWLKRVDAVEIVEVMPPEEFLLKGASEK